MLDPNHEPEQDTARNQDAGQPALDFMRSFIGQLVLHALVLAFALTCIAIWWVFGIAWVGGLGAVILGVMYVLPNLGRLISF